MPNFNTHWCVALAALPQAPLWIQEGFDAYGTAARRLATDVRDALLTVRSIKDASDFGAKVKKSSAKFLSEPARGGTRTTPDVPCLYDKVTAFSAYTLGACGPDFWTVTQGVANTTGTLHFDLGHYNRTHAQFLVTTERLARADKTSLQAMVEQAYFLGMATHVAADLVIHQLVNRSAGAYNLLDKPWENENGSLPFNIWSTHNKVEHYWDSYLRFRYLGDYGGVFPADEDEPPDATGARRAIDGPKEQWFAPHGFPVLERLLEHVRSALFKSNLAAVLPKARGTPSVEDLCAKLVESLSADDVRYAYERPLTPPHLFCDRLLADEVRPFVYDVVVEKTAGAYPEDFVPKPVTKEAKSWRMKYDGAYSEKNKALYFTSERNEGCSGTSNNYLTYVVCPNLEQVRRFGRGVFYDLDALRPFMDRAVLQAKQFMAELSSAYGAAGTRMPSLENHWNLDTGIGLRVVRVKGKHDTPKEAVTRLDFIQVLDPSHGGVQADPPAAEYGYLGSRSRKQWNPTMGRAFETMETATFARDEKRPPYENVAEEADSYLPRIRLEPGLATPTSKLTIDDDTFFAGSQRTLKDKITGVFSKASRPENKVVIEKVAHRLNLEVRGYVSRKETAQGGANLGDHEVGMFLFGDRTGVQDPVDGTTTKDWFPTARMLGYGEQEPPRENGLRVLTTRLLANFEPRKDLTRSHLKGEWNNVVPYSAHEKDYGRNFVLCTARKNVLHPNDSGNFDPASHYDVYDDVSPTEQVFFSLYALVHTPEGVFDVLGKELVQASRMDEIRRIQEVGFMKIVLFYELTGAGACQLSECWVDGMHMPVVEVTES